MKKGGNLFQALDKAPISRSAFDLSHEHKTTFDMGQLIPISCIECIPGDVHRIGAAAVLRMQPMLAPILHQVKLRYYSFFVPYRLLDDDWEEFITRGEDGESVIALPLFKPADFTASIANVTATGSLWDYLGYNPVDVASDVADQCLPIDYPRRAYVKIWNEFFRVPGIQDALPEGIGVAGEVYMPLYRNWTRGYFEAALPFQQRGVPVSLPIFGTSVSNAEFDLPWANWPGTGNFGTMMFDSDTANVANVYYGLKDAGGFASATISGSNGNAIIKPNVDATLSDNNSVTLDGSSLSSVDIADLRLAWQTQVWMERNARGGARYTEQLQARYGTRPLDARLQRPEYIGGYTSPFLFSEVLQTSSSAAQPTVQGNMAGHGISVQGSNIGSYRVDEHGLIMVIACADPVPAYQQGIERSWLRRNTLDFPTPEFVHLSEQEILNCEIYNQPTSADPTGSIGRTPFGYTGIYNEMRYIPNRVSSEMRETFDYWHLARKFTTLPELNEDFLSIEPDLPELKRIYAVANVPGIIGSFGIRLTSVRPIPYLAVPSAIGGRA